jgi:hypothetical protein
MITAAGAEAAVVVGAARAAPAAHPVAPAVDRAVTIARAQARAATTPAARDPAAAIHPGPVPGTTDALACPRDRRHREPRRPDR